MKEETGKELDTIALLTETVEELAYAVQSLNAIIVVLLHNTDLKMPEWKGMEDIEEDVGPKVQECVKFIGSLHGHDKADKS